MPAIALTDCVVRFMELLLEVGGLSAREKILRLTFNWRVAVADEKPINSGLEAVKPPA
jgi:hypothetical protein